MRASKTIVLSLKKNSKWTELDEEGKMYSYIAYENVKHVVSEEQEFFPRLGVKDTQESSNNLKVIFISFLLIVDSEALIIYINNTHEKITRFWLAESSAVQV